MNKTIEGYELRINALAAALTHAGNEDVRYYLNGVYLDFPKGRIVATDGHRLFCGAITPAECEPVIVPRGLIEQALKADKGIKARDRLPALAVNVVPGDDGFLRVTLNVVHAGARLTDKAVDGRFPDYERVIPGKTSGEVGQFNAEYLAEAQTALRKYGALPDTYKGTIEHNGPNSPCLISMTSAEAFVVVMPVYGPSEPVGTGEWYALAGKAPTLNEEAAA